jgi:hypothetical protein
MMSGTLWNELREKLKMTMKKEVGMMREILANMHQEESSLLFGDQTCWEQVIKERSLLIERLGDLRRVRMEATHQLEEIAPFARKDKRVSLEQLLALDDEVYGQIMLMRDQISALLERINFQNSCNQHLLHQREHHVDLNGRSFYNAPLEALDQKPKKKIGIATCDPED